ncbi:hypothetical protein M885DRAFT_499181 [Pelagophyceae sp. CCMP2097]|nr:hypothetical protein M885DRAFT_499181 [Pelagophyceae sp. CCMP2097]
MAMQVNPLFRIVSDAHPFIAARLLTGDAPELQLALRNLLFKDDQPQWSRLEALVDRATAAQDYDATKAILLFVDLVAADDAEALRDNLVDDVVTDSLKDTPPLPQRLLEHATVRRVAAEVAAKLTERFASRAIRLGSFRFV